MLEFAASKVQVYKDDDAETIVGFYGENGDAKPRYLELALLVRSVRGVYNFAIKAEVGRPKRVGQDCVTSAELKRDSFSVVFTQEGSLAKVGGVRVAFTVAPKEYRDLKRGLEEVFCEGDLLRVVPVKGS